jgi:hypothetical protein
MSDVAAFLTRVRGVLDQSGALDDSIALLASHEVKFRATPSLLLQQDVETIEDQVLNSYRAAIHETRLAIELLDSIPPIPESARPLYTGPTPTRESIRGALVSFFRAGVHPRTSNVSLYGGCHASRIRSPRPNSFLCAAHRSSFILVIVWQLIGDVCCVFDPAECDRALNPIELAPSQWTALPTVIPASPAPHWEFPVGTPVLSLWRKDEHSEWTTEFYEARVKLRPCDRPDPPRGYFLDFGEGAELVVPERFVCAVHDAWNPV